MILTLWLLLLSPKHSPAAYNYSLAKITIDYEALHELGYFNLIFVDIIDDESTTSLYTPRLYFRDTEDRILEDAIVIAVTICLANDISINRVLYEQHLHRVQSVQFESFYNYRMALMIEQKTGRGSLQKQVTSWIEVAGYPLILDIIGYGERRQIEILDWE